MVGSSSSSVVEDRLSKLYPLENKTNCITEIFQIASLLYFENQIKLDKTTFCLIPATVIKTKQRSYCFQIMGSLFSL